MFRQIPQKKHIIVLILGDDIDYEGFKLGTKNNPHIHNTIDSICFITISKVYGYKLRYGDLEEILQTDKIIFTIYAHGLKNNRELISSVSGKYTIDHATLAHIICKIIGNTKLTTLTLDLKMCNALKPLINIAESFGYKLYYHLLNYTIPKNIALSCIATDTMNHIVNNGLIVIPCSNIIPHTFSKYSRKMELFYKQTKNSIFLEESRQIKKQRQQFLIHHKEPLYFICYMNIGIYYWPIVINTCTYKYKTIGKILYWNYMQSKICEPSNIAMPLQNKFFNEIKFLIAALKRTTTPLYNLAGKKPTNGNSSF